MTSVPTALVTGTSRGIGRGLARFLSARGYSVIGCSRSAAIADDSYEQRQLDVGDEAAVQQLVADVARTHGHIDLLVNNAGIGSAAMALHTSRDLVELAWRSNFLGTFLLCREVGKLMMTKRSGRIVNLASVAVPLEMEGASVYSATKAAVIQFSKVFAKEMASFGVTCNVVAPSIVDTEMLRSLKPTAVEAYLARLTIPRMITIDEVCDAVWLFARPESAYLTGQVIYLGYASP